MLYVYSIFQCFLKYESVDEQCTNLKRMTVNKNLYSIPISQSDNNNPRMYGSLTTKSITAADLFLPLVSEVA